MPAITKAARDAGTANVIRNPRIALKTSGACMFLTDLLPVLDEVFGKPCDSRHHQKADRGDCTWRPSAATAVLNHRRDNKERSSDRADDVSDPVHDVEKSPLGLRCGLTLYRLTDSRRGPKVLCHRVRRCHDGGAREHKG